MSWTTPADIRLQALKLWDKGLLLSSLACGEDLFPRRMTLRGPTSAELADRFDEARGWISELLSGQHYRVVMRQLRHRVIGNNAVPEEIWIDTLDDALRLIGKVREAAQFRGLVEQTQRRRPALLLRLSRHPLKTLDLAGDWPLLLDFIDWMEAHPRPEIYLRQVDIKGVHTKFIEARRAVLSELLDLALPPEAVDPSASGPRRFCGRYGFLERPQRIRFRILDRTIALLPGGVEQDIAVNQDTFNKLELKAGRVFMTENEVNFLAFPDFPESIVIFGGGYGFDVLSKAQWLRDCRVHYWGDIDTHGFAILDQLRTYLPKAESFLMDRNTLMAHKPLWGSEPQPVRRELHLLDEKERALFKDLRDDIIGHAVRLEQERIGFGWVRAALNELAGR